MTEPTQKALDWLRSLAARRDHLAAKQHTLLVELGKIETELSEIAEKHDEALKKLDATVTDEAVAARTGRSLVIE